MRTHPGITMLIVWAMAVAAFVILPFQIETRTVTTHGFLILALFLGTFVAGSFLASPILPRKKQIVYERLDMARADKLIFFGTLVAIFALLAESATTSVTTLEGAFLDRNERSVGVLLGQDTGGSIFFQIGFLTYPIAFVAIVREILFRERIRIYALAFFGFLPPVLAALVMGGRGTILFAFVVLVAAFWTRGVLFPRSKKVRSKESRGRRVVTAIAVAAGMMVAMDYFVDVFLVRANVAGGVQAMSQIAAYNWGVSFNGKGSETLYAIVGESNAYLIYIFIWYLVQGLLISNTIFSEFTGDPTLGIYGVDLATAVARRIDPEFVSSRFLSLAGLNVYGFLPNAFGSLYVDFKFFGLVLTFAWGFACGFVYRRTMRSSDARWLFVWPLISVGLIFSLLNTPLGFNNGFTTHIWFLAVTLLIRRVHGTRTQFVAA